jgi:hypothetical protein
VRERTESSEDAAGAVAGCLFFVLLDLVVLALLAAAWQCLFAPTS